MKAEQPRNLGYMHVAIIEVTDRQVPPEVLTRNRALIELFR
jgi:hypothetical protein